MIRQSGYAETWFSDGSSFRLWNAAGRIRLEMRIERIGGDLLVRLTGGAAHVGALAMADACGARCLQRYGHREGEIAEKMAETLAGALGCAVAVICGIHYGGITKAEIEDVLRLAAELQDNLIMLARQNSFAGNSGSEN